VKLSLPSLAPRLKKFVNLYVVYIGFPLFLFVMLLSAKGMDQGRIMIFLFCPLVSSIIYYAPVLLGDPEHPL
jgi:predicted permease